MKRYRVLDRKLMLAAFERLDSRLDRETRLVVGGGAAMILAYGHPLATGDVDAFSVRGSLTVPELAAVARDTAKELDIPPDWLNGHFATFTHVLPDDYRLRLRPVFGGRCLTVEALGPEDLLLMKCFSGRDKDRSHLLRLVRIAGDLDIVDNRFGELMDKRVPGAARAADYFDDLRDEVDL